MAQHTIVTTGTEDNYFGIGIATHISVTPRTASPGAAQAWWVLVAEELRVKSISPCLRTDKQFQLMHRALEDRQAGFTQPLPHLPLHSTLLQSHEEDAFRLGEALQDYVAALHVHPEASTLKAYLDFVTPTPDGTEAVELEDSPSAVQQAPVIVRSRSHGSCLTPGNEEAPPAPTNACTRVKLSWSDEDGEHEVELPVLTPAHGMGKKGARARPHPGRSMC